MEKRLRNLDCPGRFIVFYIVLALLLHGQAIGGEIGVSLLNAKRFPDLVFMFRLDSALAGGAEAVSDKMLSVEEIIVGTGQVNKLTVENLQPAQAEVVSCQPGVAVVHVLDDSLLKDKPLQYLRQAAKAKYGQLEVFFSRGDGKLTDNLVNQYGGGVVEGPRGALAALEAVAGYKSDLCLRRYCVLIAADMPDFQSAQYQEVIRKGRELGIPLFCLRKGGFWGGDKAIPGPVVVRQKSNFEKISMRLREDLRTWDQETGASCYTFTTRSTFSAPKDRLRRFNFDLMAGGQVRHFSCTINLPLDDQTVAEYMKILQEKATAFAQGEEWEKFLDTAKTIREVGGSLPWREWQGTLAAKIGELTQQSHFAKAEKALLTLQGMEGEGESVGLSTGLQMRLQLGQAEQLFKAGNSDEAIRKLDAFKSLFEQLAPERRQKEADLLRQSQKMRADLLLREAVSCVQKGSVSYGRALELLDRLEELKDQVAPEGLINAQLDQGRRQRARIYLETGKHDSALAVLDTIIEKEVEDSRLKMQVLRQQAQAMAQGGDFATALVAYERTLEADGYSVADHLRYARGSLRFDRLADLVERPSEKVRHQVSNGQLNQALSFFYKDLELALINQDRVPFFLVFKLSRLLPLLRTLRQAGRGMDAGSYSQVFRDIKGNFDVDAVEIYDVESGQRQAFVARSSNLATNTWEYEQMADIIAALKDQGRRNLLPELIVWTTDASLGLGLSYYCFFEMDEADPQSPKTMLRMTIRADLSPEAADVLPNRQRGMPLAEVTRKICASIAQDLAKMSVCVLGNFISHAILTAPDAVRGKAIDALSKRYCSFLEVLDGWRYLIAISDKFALSESNFLAAPVDVQTPKKDSATDGEQGEAKSVPGKLVYNSEIKYKLAVDEYENGRFNRLPMFGYRTLTLQEGFPDEIFEAVQPIKLKRNVIGVLRLGLDPDRCCSSAMPNEEEEKK